MYSCTYVRMYVCTRAAPSPERMPRCSSRPRPTLLLPVFRCQRSLFRGSGDGDDAHFHLLCNHTYIRCVLRVRGGPWASSAESQLYYTIRYIIPYDTIRPLPPRSSPHTVLYYAVRYATLYHTIRYALTAHPQYSANQHNSIA